MLRGNSKKPSIGTYRISWKVCKTLDGDIFQKHCLDMFVILRLERNYWTFPIGKGVNETFKHRRFTVYKDQMKSGAFEVGSTKWVS